MAIYVGNLHYEVEEGELREVFAEYGTVRRVYLPEDRETGKKRGFGFVEMSTDDEEDKAIETLDGAEWMGRQLKVNKARPRENDNRDSNRGSGGGYRKNNNFSRRGGGDY
ncbi:RNA recognition motif domain-containing protein [Gloeothece verrucosa]|uniref:RNP-1 like RNA-binding protein n=1 Tax=Gloeothece verrucosa (strain PCC 7822) TaxID=497965 RepID=E0U622_GLOV7|nr:RNA-binding protein [Gloeothece verrucosa]ADN17131.1 RNP-1 like RNA-binding protein [Gloeothece verrucosa PCC 7822]